MQIEMPGFKMVPEQFLLEVAQYLGRCPSGETANFLVQLHYLGIIKIPALDKEVKNEVSPKPAEPTAKTDQAPLVPKMPDEGVGL